MLTTSRNLFLCIFFCAFVSCTFKSSTENVVDDYQVTWIGEEGKRSLYKHEKIIPAYVFAVGYTSKFIIAKQHPLVSDASDQINTAVVNYFIIERSKIGFQDKPIYGPLNETEFKSKCNSLQIENLQFTKNYPENVIESIAAN